jgi:hypothetical protein
MVNFEAMPQDPVGSIQHAKNATLIPTPGYSSSELQDALPNQDHLLGIHKIPCPELVDVNARRQARGIP